MKHIVFYLSLILLIGTVRSSKWEDCGIPLTREIYYQSVTVSPYPIDISTKSSDRRLSINVNANLQNIVNQGINVNVRIVKDGATYFDAPVGDLCSILQSANQVYCPLAIGTYSFSYLYELPPLPSGNYTVIITTINTKNGDEIGCLSVHAVVSGLGGKSCTYTSSFSAELAATAQFGADDTIQIGPYGPNKTDVGHEWGTFRYVDATSDLVGYTNSGYSNYVWGIIGSLNENAPGIVFTGKFVVGYRPDASSKDNAILVHEGTFYWTMTKNVDASGPPYIFQSGTFNLDPLYQYTSDFAVPVAFGNLNTFTVVQSSDGMHFTVTASRTWCRCQCDNLGGGAKFIDDGEESGSGMSRFLVGTIVTAVVGGVVIIIAVILLVLMLRSPPKPAVHDPEDLLDPQKPDYGTIAINEIFEADEREYL